LTTNPLMTQPVDSSRLTIFNGYYRLFSIHNPEKL
jgi:hypothetical protein